MDDFIVEGRVRIRQRNVVGKIEPPKLGTPANNAESDGPPTKKRIRDESADIEGGAEEPLDNAQPPSLASTGGPSTTNTLFYNPAQVFNRDISLVALKVFGERRLAEAFTRFDGASTKRHVGEEVKGLTICEPLAATGLRSLRYATELPRSIFRRVTTSDLDPFAVEEAKLNRDLNNVTATKMETVHSEATELLHCGKYVCGTSSWDVIDIDPYGTASPYMEAAIAGVKDGGMLCITSTDMPILGGNAPDVAFYKYGGCTVKARYLHEMALRLVIHQLQMTAAKHRRFVVPLLSLSVDFYVRIFVQVWDKPVRCSDLCLMTAIVYQCAACDFFVTAPFGSESERQGHRKKLRRIKKGIPKAEPADKAADSTTASSPVNDEDGQAQPLPGQWADFMQCQLYPSARTPGKKPTLGRVPPELTGPLCPECSGTLVIGGPFYAGPLHDQSFVRACLEEMDKAGTSVPELLIDVDKERLLNCTEVAQEIDNGFVGFKSLGTRQKLPEDEVAMDENISGWVKKAKARFDYEMTVFRFTHLSQKVRPKIIGVLQACTEELSHVPFFYNLSSICNHAKISMIKLDKFKSALLHLGYQVGLFHREPLSIKTDAPVTVLFDIMRCWISQHDKQNNARTPPNYVGPPRLVPLDHINFAYHPQTAKAKKEQKARWVPNPTTHWGPGKKAGTGHNHSLN